MAEIVLAKITKVYPDGTVGVKDIDLRIADGEFIILVGPSGCGKSTALNMIAGLEDITSGDLLIDGERVNENAPRERDIAMVFQSYALYPHMTVRDNMAFPLKLAKVDKTTIDEKVTWAAEILELKPFLDRKPANLSGGQRQRVAMGRAIVRNPKAFLMDEPLSNLDAKLRVQMRTTLSRLQNRLGTTTVYVTHDQTEAMTLGDRLVVMRNGVVQQVAPPQQLYDRPANIFVAGFIGSPPMNMALGRIERQDEDLVLRLGSASLKLHAAVTSDRPGLVSYAGREVAAGIRSEDMEDAGLVRGADSDSRLRAVATLTEALGSAIIVHFDVDAPRVVTEDTKLLEKDAGTEDVPHHDATRFVASFAPRSRVRPGDEIEVVVDTERMHFFDPDTGAAIRD